MNRTLFPPIFFLLLLGSCTQVTEQHSVPWDAPALERSIRVFDTHRQREISFGAMLSELARAEVVFLGETHLDETTHRTELAVYEGLIRKTRGGVVLAMEMFERDDQRALDQYTAGEIDEREFVHRVQPWSNYRSAYRPMIEAARREGLPVIGSNVPTRLQRTIAMGGEKALEELDAEQRQLLPAEFLANTAEYWARVDNAVRGHLHMMGSAAPEDRLYSTQSLWDNSMGEACALALRDFPGRMVLHVNGGFHSARWDGTVRQLRLRRPETRILTVAISPTGSLATAGAAGAEDLSDYYILADSRSRDVNEGFHAVMVPSELRYRLHVPEAASDENPVPLLIWLCDDGFSADDGLTLWKQRLGEKVAIASFEPPFPEQQPDLAVGGRWYWPETFDEDIGQMDTGIDRAWGYLLRNYPIDPETVVLAGEGTGATVVAATTLFSGRMSTRSVAVRPRHFRKLRDFPLPLDLDGEAADRPDRALLVLAGGDSEEWWQQELGDYAKTGLAGQFALASEDPWLSYGQVEEALVSRLGLQQAQLHQDRPRSHVVLETETARGRLWATVYALQKTEPGTDVAILGPADGERAEGSDPASTPLPLAIRPEDFATGATLPLAPGPFGGTTVVVLTEGTEEIDIPAWLELEKKNVLGAHSRFHRLRIATPSGDTALGQVLARLEAENRNNVLIVPALFCADPETMRRLLAEAAPFAESMTLHWSPGLGERLYRAE
ncbi:MAG: ChaN family lipoprotein [Planctomycetota bacterium]